MNQQRNWCKEVRNAGVIAVAQAFGGIASRRGERGGLTPCPGCGAEKRGKHDRRGPLGMTRDGLGWACHRCNIKGDAVTLASYLCGQDGKVNSAVRIACERAGLLKAATSQPSVQLQRSKVQSQPLARRIVREAPPSYPPTAEVATLLRECYALNASPDIAAAAWLKQRALDPALIAAAGLVLALPRTAPVPRWARIRGESWTQSGHRIVGPLCDANGVLRSLHARQIDGERAAMPKGTNPVSYEVRGLALACPRARRMLAAVESANTVLIAEGFPDWLTWFQHYQQRCQPAAVFGIVAGAWTTDFAAKIVAGTRVILAGHNDDAGNRYVAAIVKTLQTRVATGEIQLETRRAS